MLFTFFNRSEAYILSLYYSFIKIPEQTKNKFTVGRISNSHVKHVFSLSVANV